MTTKLSLFADNRASPESSSYAFGATSSNNRQVLIVGAGPTGLVAAIEVARRGVPCRIIDRLPMRSQNEIEGAKRLRQSRAIAVQARTLECFEMMGIDVDAFIASGQPIRAVNISVSTRKRIARIEFDRLPTRCPYMLLIPQHETEQMLERHLVRMGLRVEHDKELVGFEQGDDGVMCEVRDGNGKCELSKAAWLLGCDGAHSTTRHLLGASFEGSSYQSAFMIADVVLGTAFERSEMHVFTTGYGPIAFFPMRSGMWRIVADNPHADWGDEPTLDQCQSLVDQRAPTRVTLRDPRWLARVRIHRRTTPHMQVKRVFLLGDAAHIHSPGGGQGTNTGIQDAFNLAWKLAWAPNNPNAPLIASYQPERQPVAEGVVRLSDRLTRLVTLRNPVARLLRNIVWPALSASRAVRLRSGLVLSELAIGYAKSPIVEEHPVKGGLQAGSRASDGLLQNGDTSTRIYGLIASGKYTLLVFVDEPEPESVQQIVDRTVAGFSELVAVAIIASTSSGRGHHHVFTDPSGATIQQYGAGRACLVRPDGYIGFCSSIADAGVLLPRHLARGLGGARTPTIPVHPAFAVS